MYDVGRQVDEGWAGAAVRCTAVCVPNGIWDGIESGGTECGFGMRSKEGDSIKLLESALGSEVCLGRAGEEQEGKGIDGGIANLEFFSMGWGEADVPRLPTYPGHGMQYSWSSDDKTDARLGRQVSIHAGSVGGSLLIPEGDKLDPKVDGFLGNLDDGDADNAEDDGDAEIA